MEILITPQDVYNKLNIDLAAQLNVKKAANETTAVEHFITKAQNYIYSFINARRFTYIDFANLKANQLTEHTRETLKQALLYQIEYMIQNHDSATLGGIMITSSGVQTIDRRLRQEDKIAPNAEELLRVSGLCYTGRRGC